MQLKCSHWVYFKYYTGFPTGAHVAISNLQLYKSMTCWNLRRFISLQCLLWKIFVLIEKITSHFTKLTLFMLLQDYVILYTPHFWCRNLKFRFFNPSQTLMSGLQWGRHNCEQQITQRSKFYIPHWNILSMYLSQYSASLYNQPQYTQAHTHINIHTYIPHTVCILATRLIADFFCLLIFNLQCTLLISQSEPCPTFYYHLYQFLDSFFLFPEDAGFWVKFAWKE